MTADALEPSASGGHQHDLRKGGVQQIAVLGTGGEGVRIFGTGRGIEQVEGGGSEPGVGEVEVVAPSGLVGDGLGQARESDAKMAVAMGVAAPTAEDGFQAIQAVHQVRSRQAGVGAGGVGLEQAEQQIQRQAVEVPIHRRGLEVERAVLVMNPLGSRQQQQHAPARSACLGPRLARPLLR